MSLAVAAALLSSLALGVRGQPLTLANASAQTTQMNQTQMAQMLTRPLVPPVLLNLSGACSANWQLNGLTYQRMGTTASGAPYYKGNGAEEYLYYDPDCDGQGPQTLARWILSGSRPSTSAAFDLDQDGRCDYHARYTTLQLQWPPAVATWHMYCGTGWQDLILSLTNVTQSSNIRAGVAVSAAAAYGSAAAAALLFLPLLPSLLQ